MRLFPAAPSMPWSRHKQVMQQKHMTVITNHLQDRSELAMKPNQDNFARPPKHASHGWGSAKAGLLIPFASKQTRTTVTP
jgi:hypothetical protein